MGPARDKMLVFQPRRPDLTHEQFVEHWRTVHAGHARRISALQKYVQSHRLVETDAWSSVWGMVPSHYDGVSEAWFKGPEELAGMTSSAEYRDGALVDEPNFLDIPRKVRLLCSERIEYAAPGCEDAALAKVILALARPGEGLAAQPPTGQNAVATMVTRLPGIARYAVCEVRQMLAEDSATQIRLVLELGWRTQADLREALGTPGAGEVLADLTGHDTKATAMAAQEFRFI